MSINYEAIGRCKVLERINRELMIAVNDFNRRSPQADQRALTIHEPHEQ